jgi:hypothetical protein
MGEVLFNFPFLRTQYLSLVLRNNSSIEIKTSKEIKVGRKAFLKSKNELYEFMIRKRWQRNGSQLERE